MADIDSHNPFIVDDPVPLASDMYVEREADRQLRDLYLKGEIVHLFAPPGMGKTSLILRSSDRAMSDGLQAPMIHPLTLFDRGTVDELYVTFLEALNSELRLEFDSREWWMARQGTGVTARLLAYFEEVLLFQARDQIVLFIDEFAHPASEVFTTTFLDFIQAFIEQRSSNSQLQRISLVLSSSNRLNSVARDVVHIYLRDFTFKETEDLANAFRIAGDRRREILHTVFEWTGGHPYLTQRAFYEVYEALLHESFDGPGKTIRDYFRRIKVNDSHLEDVWDALANAGSAVLKEYQNILAGIPVRHPDVADYLGDIGLLKVGSALEIRNRVYREVFNEKWVEERLRRTTTTKDLFDGQDLSLRPGGFTVKDRYRLERRIRRGSAGDVYLTQQGAQGRSVAIRLIPARFLITADHSEDEARKDLEKVLGAVVRIEDQQNVVPVLDYGFSEDGYFYIVREYIAGESLSRFLERNGRVSVDQALQILGQIVNAIHAAHRAGVPHGDLNPFKIFVISKPGANDNDLFIKVADFSLARLMNRGPHGRPSQPPSEGEVGVPVYMAPEQIVGEGPWDERADIYALGMIAYQLFGGQVPEFQNLSNILNIKLEKRFVSLRELREGISEAAEQAIMRALEFDPKDRPPTAREWFDQISAALQPAETSATAPHQTGDFEVPVFLDSQFTVDDPETKAIETAFSIMRESLYGGMRLSDYEKNDLRGAVFVAVIRRSYTLNEFKWTYLEAKRYSFKTLVYIKRENTVMREPRPAEVLSRSAFEDLKTEMLSDGAARFFDTAGELAEIFRNDLSEWLIRQYLPDGLDRARQSSPDVITKLLQDIKDPEVLDQRLLDEVRKRQVEATGRYWFYLSCAGDDWNDENVQQFFNDLNAEVRRLTDVNEFYVGAFRHANSEVATTALREEWFPHTIVALQNSRVLVALYTPNYFKSEVCGKIWEFFHLRVIANNAQAPIILPVHWTANNELPDPLPDAVANLENPYSREALGRPSGGLRYLKRSSEQYEQFIRLFAQQVVHAATVYPVGPLNEPPPYSQLKNAFAETGTVSATEQPPYPPPPIGRWITVAGSANTRLDENLQTISIEIGREIARRGYGLISGGYNGVDYYVYQGFAGEITNEDRLKGAVKLVHYERFQPSFSGGTTILVNPEQIDIEEEIKLSDAVILISGHEGTYDFYPIAQRLGKPIFPIHSTGSAAAHVFEEMASSWTTAPPMQIPFDEFAKLKRPAENEGSAQQLSCLLLDMMGSLWLSPAEPRTEAEALASIAFIQSDLLEQAADAIVNAVGVDPTHYGEIGGELAQRIGPEFSEHLQSQGPLTTGETIITKPGDKLSAKYIIHVNSETDRGVHTIDSSIEAVKGALRRADLLGLETIAFPSIGTGGAHMMVEALAPSALGAVVDHLTQGSNLRTVLFVFKNQTEYQAYYDAFISMGGTPGYRVVLLYFANLALSALRFAEALRLHLGRNRISSSVLLWGLYRAGRTATRQLLESCKTASEIDISFNERLGITDTSNLYDLEPAPFPSLSFASFTPHGDQAFIKAQELAAPEVISERHLLAGLLSVPGAHGTKWLSKITGLSVEDLFDIVADENKSIPDEIASRRATTISVDTTAWTLSLSPPQLNGQKLNDIRVGELVTLTISLDPAPVIAGVETLQNILRIPINSLELTGWIRAPGCQLPLEIPFTIKTIDGHPETRSFSFDLKPLLSGPRKVEVEIYAGGHVSNLSPSIVTHMFRVASPVVLPDIKELIDRRRIPNPQPDVMLYVALQETPTHQQTQLYLTCAALDLDRQPLEPPLQLNKNDIAELRTLAIESAAKANGLSPADALRVLRGVGADLFDRLITANFEDCFQEINQLAAITKRTWSWLIISDEEAVLPWELVCYYGFDENGTLCYDDFFAGKFQISHWVGQRGLRLMNTVPVGDIDLIHYNQRSHALQGWTTALDPDLVKVESDAGQMSLLQEGSYCFGLHLLRYAQEQQTKQIVAIEEDADEDGRTDGEAITGDKKLDLSLRRPTVGLSFVSELPITTPGSAACNTHLESSWLLPFMQAGASALYGPRWPVSVEVDQVFTREFYDVMREGETLGTAFVRARARVRATFPQRFDWLAYTYFGHPHATPYAVQPAQGFTLFEAVNHPENELFRAGATYRFRASYRTEAPAWYEGRLQIQQGNITAQDLSVIVMPLTGVQPMYCPLEPVGQGNELQGIISLTMPKVEANETTNLPIMIRFQKENEELRTMFLNLPVKGEF